MRAQINTATQSLKLSQIITVHKYYQPIVHILMQVACTFRNKHILAKTSGNYDGISKVDDKDVFSLLYIKVLLISDHMQVTTCLYLFQFSFCGSPKFSKSANRLYTSTVPYPQIFFVGTSCLDIDHQFLSLQLLLWVLGVLKGT